MKITGVTYVTRRKTPKKVIISLLALFLVICLALLSGYNTWAVLVPENSASNRIRPDKDMNYEQLDFKSLDGVYTLNGILFKSEIPVVNSGNSSSGSSKTRTSDKTIIMVHDYERNKYQFSSDTLELVKKLNEKGFNVLIFDTRASGESDGNMVTLGIKEKYDVLGAVKQARDRGAKNIYILGFGSGAASAIIASGEKVREAGYIDAIIADSPYAEIGKYLDKILPERIIFPHFPVSNLTGLFIKIVTGSLNSVSPTDSLLSMKPKPVLFIHGEKDKSPDTKSLFDTYSNINPDYAHYWKARGSSALNNYTTAPSTYVNKIVSFLNSVD